MSPVRNSQAPTQYGQRSLRPYNPRAWNRLLVDDTTRDDLQRRVLAQHRAAIWNSVATTWNNVTTMLQRCVFVKNRRCESSRATSPLKVFYVLKGNFSSFFKLLYAI